jgi:uncharacterized membrane protein YesL
VKLENSLFSILNSFSDWLIRIVMINILMILTSLPIITLYASLQSGYRLMHDYVNKNETSIFRGYFTYFMEGLKKNIGLGLLFSLVIGLTVLNVTYYVDIIQENAEPLYVIGYYVTIAAMIGVYIVLVHSFSCHLVFPKIKIKHLFKISFYVSGKFFFRTVVLMAIHLISILMFTTPITLFIFIFVGLSIPILLNAMVTNKVVIYLQSLGEKHD